MLNKDSIMGKGIKDKIGWKLRNKMSVFKDDMIMFIKKYQKTPQKNY